MYGPTDRDTDRQTKFTDITYMWGSLRLAQIAPRIILQFLRNPHHS